VSGTFTARVYPDAVSGSGGDRNAKRLRPLRN
jgi:hypothetical protein